MEKSSTARRNRTGRSAGDGRRGRRLSAYRRRTSGCSRRECLIRTPCGNDRRRAHKADGFVEFSEVKVGLSTQVAGKSLWAPRYGRCPCKIWGLSSACSRARARQVIVQRSSQILLAWNVLMVAVEKVHEIVLAFLVSHTPWEIY